MTDSNPFQTPTDTAGISNGSRNAASVGIYGIFGGAIGAAIGLLGIVALFFLAPGSPGVAELLILGTGIATVFVLPGVVIGVVIALLRNSKSSGKPQ